MAMHPLVAMSLSRLIIIAVVSCCTLICCVVGYLLVRRSKRGRAWMQVRRERYATWRRMLGAELAEPGSRYLWGFLGAVLVPVYLLIVYPPFFNASDAVSMYSWSLASHLPHWKPVYLLFVRGINLAVAGTFNFKLEAPVSLVAVYVTICVQHVLAVGAVSLFVGLAVRSRLRAFLFALCVGVVSPLFMYTHGIFLSVFVLIGIFPIAAAALLVLRHGKVTPLAMVLALVGATLGVGARHDGMVIALLLPLAGCAAWLLQGRGWRIAARSMGVTLVLLVGLSAANTLMQWVLAVPGGSVYGRAGVTFFDAKYQPEGYAPSDEVGKRIAELTEDSLVSDAAILAVRYGANWTRIHARMRAELEQVGAIREGIPEGVMPAIWPQIDTAMNGAYQLYVAEYPGRYLRQIVDVFLRYSRGYDLVADSAALAPPEYSRIFLKEAAGSELFKEFGLGTLSDAAYARAAHDPLFLAAGLPPFVGLGLCLSGGILSFVFGAGREKLFLALCLGACSVGYLLFLSLACANTPIRLVAPVVIMLGLAIMILVFSQGEHCGVEQREAAGPR